VKRHYEQEYYEEEAVEDPNNQGGPPILQLKRKSNKKQKEQQILVSIQKAMEEIVAKEAEQASFMKGINKGRNSRFVVIKRAVQANQMTAEQANEILMKNTRE
jgi:hypothetical protein